RAAARAARLVHRSQITYIQSGARAMVERLGARSDAQSCPPLRPGAGARRRAAARCRAAARALPAYAGVGGALCGPPARAAVERLGACEGHLDHARVGKAREARRVRLAR